MNKRIQVILPQQALDVLDSLHKEATAGFNVGTISLSDVVTEIILTSEIDVEDLRIKRTNVQRYLKNMAKDKNVDLDLALKTLQDLKNQIAKKQRKMPKPNDGAET